MKFSEMASRIKTGTEKLGKGRIANAAKTSWKLGKTTAKSIYKSAPGQAAFKTAKGMASLIQPKKILDAAVGDSKWGQAAVDMLWDKFFTPKPEEKPAPEPAQEKDDSVINKDMLDKLDKIDDDVVEVKEAIHKTTAGLSSTITTTINNQTQALQPEAANESFIENRAPNGTTDVIDKSDKAREEKVDEEQAEDISRIRRLFEKFINASKATGSGLLSNIANNTPDGIKDKARSILGSLKGRAGKIASAGKSVLGSVASKGKSVLSRTGAIGKSLAQRAKSMPSAVRASAGTIKSVASKIGTAGRAGATMAAGAGKSGLSTIAELGGKGLSTAGSVGSKGLSAAGSIGRSAASGVSSLGRAGLSSVGGIGRAAATGLGAIGTGAAAAGTAALVFGGTGLYSAYKAAKGEDASNWISNLADKGYKGLTGSNGSIGGDIYDKLHDENGDNKISKFFGFGESQPVDAAKKSLITSSLPKSAGMGVTKITPAKAQTQEVLSPQRAPEPAVATLKQNSQDTMRIEKEEKTKAPVIIAPPQQTKKNTLGQGNGGGQSSAPIVTRAQDSSLRRIGDSMLEGSM